MSEKPRRLMPPAGGKTQIQAFAQENFARRLHDAMNARGWCQSDLARAVWGDTNNGRGAKGRDRISSYINGRSFPEPSTLRKLADTLGMKTEDLAPEATISAVERENPSFAITAVDGHPDKVVLRVNMLVSMETALEVGFVLTPKKHD